MADCGDQSPPLEVLVCFWIHHQQPGLISPFFDEGHHLCMPHALDVNAINLENTHTHKKEGCFCLKESGFYMLFFLTAPSRFMTALN